MVSGAACDITFDFTTAQGYKVTGSYSGPLSVEGIPGPETTLDGDCTINTEGCIGETSYYGNGYYGTDGGYWEISVLPEAGSDADGFVLDLVSPSLDFSEGIISGTCTFSFSFDDGFGHTWSGEWTGEVALADGTAGFSQASVVLTHKTSVVSLPVNSGTSKEIQVKYDYRLPDGMKEGI